MLVLRILQSIFYLTEYTQCFLCPKGKTEYEIAEDRKEYQRKAEDCEKEEVQMQWV